MGIVFCIIFLMAFFKIAGWMLCICGKAMGIIFSIIGYLLIAIFAVVGLGLAIVIVPVILIAGFISIGFLIGRTTNR